MKNQSRVMTLLVLGGGLLACSESAPPSQSPINNVDVSEQVVITSSSPWVKAKNIMINTEAKTIYLPLNTGAYLRAFDPELVTASGIKLTPPGKIDVSDGPITIELNVNQQAVNYQLTAKVNNNPVLSGYYADPEIIYSQKDQQYYLYPTSDGFDGWSGTYFETFSSPDLVNWTNRGVILDLKKDVSWADRNAWAPTAIETQIDGQYRYFYYFTAAQKIGVASAENPSGPFVDSGQALIDFRPEGVEGGQEIDPDVFHDPVSGKHYLYWGNGYMAAAELNEDMLSIDKQSVQVMTPDSTFREGVEVFYRNGTYYFLWSENDTRDADYRVRYATATSPLGPLTIPENNLVIEQNVEQQIYATGHNSVIKKNDADEWFIVYHRFSRPEGIKMGGAAGFNREVCIDKLDFDKDGSIVQIIPTLEGIAPAR